jgi:hypothetical protein
MYHTVITPTQQKILLIRQKLSPGLPWTENNVAYVIGFRDKVWP